MLAVVAVEVDLLVFADGMLALQERHELLDQTLYLVGLVVAFAQVERRNLLGGTDLLRARAGALLERLRFGLGGRLATRD